VALLGGMLDMISARPDDTGCAKAAVPAINRPADIAIKFLMVWFPSDSSGVVPADLKAASQPVLKNAADASQVPIRSGEHVYARGVVKFDLSSGSEGRRTLVRRLSIDDSF
jgi:hypothetical protein